MSWFTNALTSFTNTVATYTGAVSDSQAKAAVYALISASLVEDNTIDPKERAKITQALFTTFPSLTVAKLEEVYDSSVESISKTDKDLRKVYANRYLTQAGFSEDALKALMSGITQVLKSDGDFSAEEKAFLTEVMPV